MNATVYIQQNCNMARAVHCATIRIVTVTVWIADSCKDGGLKGWPLPAAVWT